MHRKLGSFCNFDPFSRKDAKAQRTFGKAAPAPHGAGAAAAYYFGKLSSGHFTGLLGQAKVVKNYKCAIAGTIARGDWRGMVIR